MKKRVVIIFLFWKNCELHRECYKHLGVPQEIEGNEIVQRKRRWNMDKNYHKEEDIGVL